jgi:hypothetical protein
MANQTAKLANQLGAPGPEAVYRNTVQAKT